MKFKRSVLSMAVLASVLGLSGCNDDDNHNATNPGGPDTELPVVPDTAETAYTKYVDPFIGTGGTGHTFPGAVTPRGMIQVSPQTDDFNTDWWAVSSGYHDKFDDLIGFAHTALSGTGINGLGNLHVLPMTEVDVNSNEQFPGKANVTTHREKMDKTTEEAKPGYYAVKLANSGIQAEVTSTDRVGYHRYTFPEGADKKVRFMVDGFNTSSQYTRIEVVDDTTLLVEQAGAHFQALSQKVYFIVKLSQPMTGFELYSGDEKVDGNISEDFYEVGVNPDGGRYAVYGKSTALISFDNDSDVVEAQVAISFTGYEGATANYNEEGGSTFDAVYVDANNKWHDVLQTIQLEGGSEEQLETFYSALYHTNIAPHIFEDVDGQYRAMANGDEILVKQNTDDVGVFSTYSLWDTFRAVHPLKTITQPEHAVELAKDLIRKYEDGGLLPKWELHGDYTGVMVGYPAVAVIADAMTKYPEEFSQEERERALEAAVESSRYHPEDFQHWDQNLLTRTHNPHIDRIDDRCVMTVNPAAPVQVGDPCGFVNGVNADNKDGLKESVSYGLEMAHFDWAVAKIASLAGDSDVVLEYTRRSQLWRKYWSPSDVNNPENDHSKHQMTGFMRPIMEDGTFMTNFNPYYVKHEESNYTEGTAWQWTWFVPHDVDGLKNIMGGEESFAANLDRTFTAVCSDTYPNAEDCPVTADMSGMIGQVVFGNEPSHHTPFLYNWTAEPWKTQEVVNYIQHEMYGTERDDIIGNEDVGQMSAWYVMASLGFYQVSGSDPVYTVGRPLFDKATLPVKGGEFTVVAENNSSDNMYIKFATINGQPLDENFTFKHEDFKAGGELRFIMTGNKSEAMKTAK